MVPSMETVSVRRHVFFLASLALAHEEGGMAMNAGGGFEGFLAVEFAVVDKEFGTHDGSTWACVNLVLRPEEGTKFERFAEVEHRPHLSKASAELKAAETACFEKGGVYTRVEDLRAFINQATGDSGNSETCDANSGSCGAAKGASVAWDDEPRVDGSPRKSSPLAQGIKGWNDRFFNMDAAETRESTVRFHARGSEPRHLSQEVTHLIMPVDVQKRIFKNLETHRKTIFGGEGAGQGGTTGAHFLSGNVGFGNKGQGGSMMDLILTKPQLTDPNSSCFQGRPAHENEAHAYDMGYVPLGGHNDDPHDDHDDDACDKSPDMQRYEDEVLRGIKRRSDVQYLLGDDVDVQWQHRLWRFGPDFDPKTKGGIWHKDTCPFGINGALPEGSLMFTTVYILYTENLDGPTAGTRVRDDDGELCRADGCVGRSTIANLPCIAGEGNTIRSGESDQNIFFHSGPLNIRKMDPSKPAYRVMMQTKAVLRHKHWRHKFRSQPQIAKWRGLKVESFDEDGRRLTGDASKDVAALKHWLNEASGVITAGIAESNAVGFEAYPVNVGRAWEVTRDLGQKLGFRTSGFLPEPDPIQTPVMLFGFDIRHTEELIDLLMANGFAVVTLASDVEFDPLRAARQDFYSNKGTGDVNNAKKVRKELLNSHFDMHMVVDVPPVGPRALDQTLLKKYRDVFAEAAAKSRGEGRLATVTLLSQQMPTPAGGEGGESDVQKAFLEDEKQWVAFGAEHGVRIVVMRVADRVVAQRDSAMRIVKGTQEAGNPCRVEVCDNEQPLTRVHSEDLHNVLLRMLSMFDIVDTHGADSSMNGTASFGSSISRFPSGKVLEIVDDGPADSMAEAKLWAGVMMGDDVSSALSSACATTGKSKPAPTGHRADKGRNAELKRALGMPKLKYPSYKYGGAKFFGAGEM